MKPHILLKDTSMPTEDGERGGQKSSTRQGKDQLDTQVEYSGEDRVTSTTRQQKS